MNRDQFVQKRALYEIRHDGDGPAAEKHCPPPQILSLEKSGFSLLVDGRPMFLPFRDHPAFADVPVDKLCQVRRTGTSELYWPELGIKVCLTTLQHGGAAA